MSDTPAPNATGVAEHPEEAKKTPVNVLRDVQIAARHADPRTARRYDRSRQNRDRHPNYVLVSYTGAGS